MKIEDIIKKHKTEQISKELKIPKSTLHKWINHQGIKNHIKFIDLLIYLDMDIKTFVEKYKKENKPWN